MGVTKYKATSPGRRVSSVNDFAELTDKRKRPEKSLCERMTRHGGRNHHGRITAHHSLNDVFAMGALVWEMLAGRPLFDGVELAGILDRVALDRRNPSVLVVEDYHHLAIAQIGDDLLGAV